LYIPVINVNAANNKIAGKAYQKYISGQMYLIYKHGSYQEARQLQKEYQEIVKNLKLAKTNEQACKIGKDFVQKINSFIDFLTQKQILTEVEAQINKLHVPHFPAEYVNYDQDNFEPLVEISQRVTGKYFKKEKFKYKKMNVETRNYYFKIVGG